MNPKQRSDTLLAGLQQLCSLGLTSEVVVPDLLKGLNALFSADNAQVMWVDKHLNPCNFYCHADEATFLQAFTAQAEQLTIPGQKPYKRFLLEDGVTAVGGSDDRNYYRSSYYHEVMRACGGECTLAIPIRDVNGVPRSSLGLNRSLRTQPFSELERKRCAAFSTYLSLLFSPRQESDDTADHQRIGEQGMAIFGAAGQLLHCDDTARQLLFLSGHPQFVPAGNRCRNPDLDARIRRICGALQAIFQGTPAALPAFAQTMPWGRILFRAHRLSPAGGNEHLTGMDIVRYIPRRMATWRQISALDLPLRQRQVCLEFAENRSLSEIAALLGISRNTVIDHVNRIYSRYGLEPGRENLQEYLLRAEGQEA